MREVITLGSLFDGIGGFPLCAVLSGATPIWAAEVDAACVALTKQRFPGMRHYGDVSKINGADLPPVDIATRHIYRNYAKKICTLTNYRTSTTLNCWRYSKKVSRKSF